MRREVLFVIFLLSTVYSLIFAYKSLDKSLCKYFFLLCSLLQLMGAGLIYMDDIENLEGIHALLFIFCFAIVFCIQSPIVNLYALIIIIVMLLTRLWCKGCLFYEKDDGNDGIYLSNEQSIFMKIMAISIILGKLMYFIRQV